MIDALKLDGLHTLLDCGHDTATVLKVEEGERIEGEDWRVLRRLFEVRCDHCATKARFSFEKA